MSTHQGARIPVPPAGSEQLSWRPQRPEVYSGAERARQTGAYAAAVPAEIAGLEVRLSAADAADAEEAARALVAFDAHAVRALGVDDPALAPMSAILLRTESASSSQIERLTTSAKQLALAEIDEGEKANAREVVGNVRAMEAALALSADIDEQTILAMHRELLRDDLIDHGEAGRFREQQVWIGGDDAGPIGAEFVAPRHERVPGAVRDVVAFLRRADVPVVPLTAIAHAQFETIHPFVDGNGRTGRALAQAVIRSRGLVRAATVPISAGLLIDTARYFEALDAYRAGDAGPIVRRFAIAFRYAATTGEALVDRLAEQLDDSKAKLAGVRSDAAAWRVLPLLIGQPAVNLRYLVKQGFGEMSALRALGVLTERGVLVERTGRARNRVWQHPGVFSVLDEYAAEIRRHGV